MGIWKVKGSSSGRKSEIWDIYSQYDSSLGNDEWLTTIVDYSGDGAAVVAARTSSAVNNRYIIFEITQDGNDPYNVDFNTTLTTDYAIHSHAYYSRTDGVRSLMPIEFQSAFKVRVKKAAGGSEHMAAGAQIWHESTEYGRIIYEAGQSLIGPEGRVIRNYTYDYPCMGIFWHHGVDTEGNPINPTNSLCFLDSVALKYTVSPAGVITGGYYQQQFNDTVGAAKYSLVPTTPSGITETEVENPNNGRMYTVNIQNGVIVEHILDDYELNSWQFRNRFSLEKTFDIEAFKEVDAEVRALFGWVGDAMESNGYLNLKNSTFSAGLDLLISKEILSESEKIRLLKPKSTFQESDIITSPDE